MKKVLITVRRDVEHLAEISSAILILYFILHNTVAAFQTLRNQLAQVLEATSFVEEILLGQIETAARIRQNLVGIRQNAAVLPIS